MFSFFKKKPAAEPVPPAADDGLPAVQPSADVADAGAEAPAAGRTGWLDRLRGVFPGEATPPPEPPERLEPDAPGEPPVDAVPVEPVDRSAAVEPPAPRSWLDRLRGVAAEPDASIESAVADARGAPAVPYAGPDSPPAPVEGRRADPGLSASAEPVLEPALEAPPEADRRGWLDKLRGGLKKTGSSLAQVFTGVRIDDALYEQLEDALLMADAGVKATEYLLMDLKWRVRDAKPSDPAGVKALLADAVADLLKPLERGLVVGEHVPTVIMVVGVNGAGKTTSIGKLTRHLADADRKVLLAAADTFRAAAREQLAVWAQRAGVDPKVRTDQVEIVSQEGGDPAAVTFDAVVAAKARRCDVVIADTAGRLATQVHLMDELKKIRRVIGKAQEGAPHEVLLVVDGNTGQNALSQVQLFDAALGLTGLIVTKLDGTAKGGVLAAIALWSRERVRNGGRGVPVYFIGVGEKLEDLQTFDAREFAQALLD